MINRYLFIFVLFTFNIYAADCEKPKMPSADEWNSWLTNIKNESLERGISQNTISIHLGDVQPQSKIIMRDRCQPSTTMTLDEYLFYTITKDKIFVGKKFLKKHQPKFIQLEFNWHQLINSQTLLNLSELIYFSDVYRILPNNFGIIKVDPSRPENNIYHLSNYIFINKKISKRIK